MKPHFHVQKARHGSPNVWLLGTALAMHTTINDRVGYLNET